MLVFAILMWPPLVASSPTINHAAVQATGAPEVFFGLRTYTPTMFDGMERYVCEHPDCGELVEVNSTVGVGRLRDSRFVSLRRSSDPVHASTIGTLADASAGRLTQWRQLSALPANVPEIANYRFSSAQATSVPGSYVGLWQHSLPGPSRQTLVVLFNNGQPEGANQAQTCGRYRILASVDQRVEILETRFLYHIGVAVNLASYDGAGTVWIARMIVPEGNLLCS